MSPSAKELGLEIGDTGILHSSGKDKLNNHYVLGAEVGDKVLIVDPKKTNCLPKPGGLVGRLVKNETDFVLPPDWDLFLDPSK
jgi:hypothetical protein